MYSLQDPCLLECYAVSLGDQLTTFRSIVGSLYSKVKQSQKKKSSDYLTLNLLAPEFHI